MSVRVNSTTLVGIDAVRVEVETEVIVGLKRFSIVGLPDGVVKEAKDRVKCALENSGFEFPLSEVIVSLAPATLPKYGSGFDLAIAISILSASNAIPRVNLNEVFFIGELALDGRIKQTGSEIASSHLVKSIKGGILYVSSEASSVLKYFTGIPVVFVDTLSELIAILSKKIEPQQSVISTDIGIDSRLYSHKNYSDVIGQKEAKRAFQISAAGGHNLLMVGPPGGGKTMMAERMISLMPALERDEFFDVNKIHSAVQTNSAASGQFKPVFTRQFRAPHHSISLAGLVGGGSHAMPGEITLAHRGVLFLDEMPELRRDVLEALREPLEKRKISISRAQSKITFPSNFILVAAMNPCPCGLKGTETKEERQRLRYKSKCKCTEQEVKKYVKKLSGPLLDRIDMQLWIPQVNIEDMHSDQPLEDETPKLKAGVELARNIQKERFKSSLKLNSHMGTKDISKYCKLDEKSKAMIETAGKVYSLSARAYTRIIKLSRTIADLGNSEFIKDFHMAEALGYRIQMDK